MHQVGFFRTSLLESGGSWVYAGISAALPSSEPQRLCLYLITKCILYHSVAIFIFLLAGLKHVSNAISKHRTLSACKYKEYHCCSLSRLNMQLFASSFDILYYSITDLRNRWTRCSVRKNCKRFRSLPPKHNWKSVSDTIKLSCWQPT
jgi:hypothetical protein